MKPGELNIVYMEGSNPDSTLNDDVFDGWNDVRLVFSINSDQMPVMQHKAVATTEPGRAGTFSAPAAARGGVARIAFGQYTAWRMGHHNISKNGLHHPALVQDKKCPLPVHRDKNRDGKRTGDNVHLGVFGINQHSTRPGWRGTTVGTWSEGCLVSINWEEHLKFIALLKTDPRYMADNNFLFTTTIIAGDDLAKITT